jgi:hypothetical protein
MDDKKAIADINRLDFGSPSGFVGDLLEDTSKKLSVFTRNPTYTSFPLHSSSKT